MNADARLTIGMLHALANRFPRDPSHTWLLAQAFEKVNHPKTAYRFLQETRSRMSFAEPLLVNRSESLDFETGRVALGIGRFSESASFLEKALASNPAATNLQYLLGNAYAGAGDTARAQTYWSTCLDRENNAAYVRYCRRNLERHAPPAAGH